ncbi:Redoxin-domain-containing protein [Staphylotrichum tortipilum]|uniref:Redoxin-domain-containing protein n=1 Tax=Staphylotrichum tortipilum TaxID=2831512 RepID=A0AAN6RQG7_9PEZI|nr:Redoxin-domain-containing protein [Staphylotrichum longicolle]
MFRLPRLAPRAAPTLLRTPRAAGAASFHTTAPRAISVGDRLPDTDALMESSPGTRVNLAAEAAKGGRMLLIGVPAAFSPACSGSHVPGYVRHPGRKGFETIGVVSVNDVFVMKAWGETLDPAGKEGIRFLADPTGKFTQLLDMAFDGSAIFGGDRSKRYAIVVEDGKVSSVAVEPDNTGTSVSLAENVLGPY